MNPGLPANVQLAMDATHSAAVLRIRARPHSRRLTSEHHHRETGKVKSFSALNKYFPKKILNLSISLPFVRRVSRTWIQPVQTFREAQL
jgi:hypothetical protein